jgi:hypothetical protein
MKTSMMMKPSMIAMNNNTKSMMTMISDKMGDLTLDH